MYVFIWYNIQWGFWQQKCTIQILHTAHLESRPEWRDSALIHGVYVGRPFTIDLLGQTERKKSGEDERYLQPSSCLSRAQGWKPVLWISTWWNIFFSFIFRSVTSLWTLFFVCKSISRRSNAPIGILVFWFLAVITMGRIKRLQCSNSVFPFFFPDIPLNPDMRWISTRWIFGFQLRDANESVWLAYYK